MQSVMSHRFSNVPAANIQRSSFDRSHGFKTTFDAGWLVPVFVDEVLPGDTFNLKMNTFARLATPIVPIMDNLFCDSFFFFVPNRLIWTNWQKFNGEQIDPDDSTDFLTPQIPSTAVTGWQTHTLADYFGLPIKLAGLTVNSFHFRAYNLIYNEWFRDQNLQDSVVVDKDDGPDLDADYQLLRRGKRHDYFTSCLPWPQKGDAVSMPLGTRAPVYGDQTPAASNTEYMLWNSRTVSGDVATALSATANTSAFILSNSSQFRPMNLGTKAQYASDANSNPPYADLEDATAATINALRQAFQIQKLLERDARGGTRYTEIIRAHFGVVSPDARLQRPEYLGGGSTPINIRPIAQTSSSPATPGPTDTPQGNLAAMGTFAHNGHGFSKSFTEHGVIIGLVNVRCDLNYQQTLNRMWSRRTRYDFYWPALSHIGEQAVLKKEIFTTATSVDEEVFGYQERYAEYRYKPSQITGLFRSQATSTIDIWHLAQEFDDTPELDEEFIVDVPPVDRVIAVPSQPHFIMDVYLGLRCARPMPVYSTPGLIDHF